MGIVLVRSRVLKQLLDRKLTIRWFQLFSIFFFKEGSMGFNAQLNVLSQ